LIRGETIDHYPTIYGAYRNTQRMITKGDWKLISYPTAKVERLYNVKQDPHENNDLAKDPAYGPQLKELRQALVELSADMNDPRKPSKKKQSKKTKKPAGA